MCKRKCKEGREKGENYIKIASFWVIKYKKIMSELSCDDLKTKYFQIKRITQD